MTEKQKKQERHEQLYKEFLYRLPENVDKSDDEALREEFMESQQDEYTLHGVSRWDFN